MSSPADGVYFSAPGVASVRWDEGDQLSWSSGTAGRTPSSSRRCSKPSCAHSSSMGLPSPRRLPPTEGPHPKDQDRANREWLPRALSIGLKRFAIVVPASVVADMNLRDSMEKASGAGLDVEYFATVEEARDWVVA